MKRHLRRNRVSRQTEEELSREAVGGRQTAKHHRFARLHLDPGKEKLRAERLKDLFDEVVRSHRDAARQQHEFALPSRADDLHQLRAAVGSDGQPHCFTASPRYERRQPIAVRVANLLRFRHGINLNQFIARGDNGYLRPAKHGQRRRSASRRQRNLRALNERSDWQNHPSTANNVLPASNRSAADWPNRSVSAFHMLDHHDGVGTLWYWRAGHNLNRGARLQRTTLPLFTGPYQPPNLQWTVTKIRRPHGKSIPRRAVERRLIPVGKNRLRQHAIFGGQQRYLLCRWHRQICCLCQHHPERLIEADNADRSLAHLVLLKVLRSIA